MTLKVLRAALILSLFLCACAEKALAGGKEALAVIVNRGNPVESLTEQDLKKIYTNVLLLWPDGNPILLYEPGDHELREAFSEKVLGQKLKKTEEEWVRMKLNNEAKNPPRVLKSEEMIIRKVSSEPGAIGYVSARSARKSEEVKVVGIIE